MCFDSGGDEASRLAQQQRADEQARQERIRAGTRRIAEIFEGGALSGSDPIKVGTKYDPKKQYYTSAGALWTPPATTMVAGGARGDEAGGHWELRKDPHNMANRREWVPNTADDVAAAGKTPEQQFIDAINAGQVFGGQAVSKGTFSPEFYGNLRKSFIDYATPQLVDQYSDAKKELIYAMDRAGLTNSSANAVKQGELTKLYNTQKQDIVAQGNEYVKQTQGAVEDARQQLIQTLNATGDADAAARGAVARAQALSMPPKYSPLTQLFSDFTASLGQQAGLERASYYSGQPIARYNTGVFTPNSKSVRVT